MVLKGRVAQGRSWEPKSDTWGGPPDRWCTQLSTFRRKVTAHGLILGAMLGPKAVLSDTKIDAQIYAKMMGKLIPNGWKIVEK